jgi:hypothetical protein
MSNERAERWLRSRGYEPEPEPKWIEEGQKPDFFCPGGRPLWVEVKTFDPTVEQHEMGRAWEDLRQRCAGEDGLTGEIYLMLGTTYEQASGRWLLGQLRNGPRADGCIHTFVVPVDIEDYSPTMRFEYESTEGRVLQSSVKMEKGRYPFHPGLEPASGAWASRATIFRDGTRDEGPELYDFLESDNSLLSAAWYPSDKQLHVGATIKPVVRNNTDQRIRAAVKAANSQIRNGQKYRAAPGVCLIYHDTMDHAGDHSVAAALFGDMLIPVGGTMAEVVMGQGGAWNSRGKNNGVGAVRYLRTDDSATTIINPWAQQQVDPAIFPEAPWSLSGRSLIQL